MTHPNQVSYAKGIGVDRPASFAKFWKLWQSFLHKSLLKIMKNNSQYY